MLDNHHVDLLPCPFCGSDNIVYCYIEDNTHSFVMCDACGASICNIDSLPETDCVDLWNKRTTPN